MDNNQTEITLVNNKKIYTCDDCNCIFNTLQSYLLHWSCNGKLRCGFCFDFGHTITKCDLRLMCDKKTLEEHIK